MALRGALRVLIGLVAASAVPVVGVPLGAQAIALAPAAADDQTTTVTGTVGANGVPLSGVDVRFTAANAMVFGDATTDDIGAFSLQVYGPADTLGWLAVGLGDAASTEGITTIDGRSYVGGYVGSGTGPQTAQQYESKVTPTPISQLATAGSLTISLGATATVHGTVPTTTEQGVIPTLENLAGETVQAGALTDAGSSFSLSGVAPGTYRMVFQAQDHTIGRTEPFTVGAGEDLTVPMPHLGNGAAVGGKVISAGRALANVPLELLDDQDTLWAIDTTSKSGQFGLTGLDNREFAGQVDVLAAGHYTLTVGGRMGYARGRMHRRRFRSR